MRKSRNFKFKFLYANKPDSEKLLVHAYSVVFQKAMENLVSDKAKGSYNKTKYDYGTIQQ